MDAPAFPPGHGQDKAVYLLSVTWIQCLLSLGFILARFYCRTKVTRNLWWDDWCILIPFISIVIASCTISVYSSYGGTRHVFDLQPAQISKALEWNIISLVFCIMAITTGKVSVALLIYRIQSPSKWRTRLLISLSVSSLVVAILIIGLEYGQCTPAKKLWIPTHPGHCWDPKKINDWDIAGSCYWAFVDLLLALIPITFLWNLKLSLAKKTALCILLGLGVFAAICGAIKAYYLPTLTADSDITWITISLLIWNVTEANVIIYAACLPAIRPLFKKFFEAFGTQKRKSTRGSTSGIAGGDSNTPGQPIPLGSIGKIPSRSRIYSNGTGDWTSKEDGDSDKAHILSPDKITRSVEVKVHSQKHSDFLDQQSSWASDTELNAPWERSGV